MPTLETIVDHLHKASHASNFAADSALDARRQMRSRSPPSLFRMTVIAAAQVFDRNGYWAVSNAATGTRAALGSAGPWATASTISCSRRAPRCRSRPHVSSTGSGM